MNLSAITFTAPASWASYLVNGDHSGLEDAEQSEADACIKDLIERHGNGHVVNCGEPYFTWGRTDYGSLAGDYCEYTILA